MTDTATAVVALETKTFAPVWTKAVGDDGKVEALVAVSGNVDDGGDIIEPGAYTFDRQPKVVWSHDLDELRARVVAYEEWKPGDSRLPDDLKAKGLGALWFSMEFDLTDPESVSTYRKVKFHDDLGWSIGYNTEEATVDQEGRRHLHKIVVWEASPCTFGMNAEARTLRKALAAVRSGDAAALEAAAKDLTPEARKTLAAALAATTEGDPVSETKTTETKATTNLAGSYEETQEALCAATTAWAVAMMGDRSSENDWWSYVVGTYPDKVVIQVRSYTEGTLQFFSMPYTQADDGSVALGDATEVELQTDVVPVPGTKGAEGDLESKALEALVGLGVNGTKAGRVLSAANEATLQEAVTNLQAVLASVAKKDEGKGTGPAEGKDTGPTPEGEETTVVLDADEVTALLAEFQEG